MDLVKKLVEKVKGELVVVSNNNANVQASDFYKWMVDEYKNYMLVSRHEFLKTLNRFEEDFKDYKPFITVLKNNLDDYGATQAFFRVALELRNEK